MLNAKQVLICVVVALFIGGVSMEANSAEVKVPSANSVEFDITCATLAVASGQEEKALYYINLVPADVGQGYFEKVVRSVTKNIYKYAAKQQLPPAEVAGYGFSNYGCGIAFI